MALQLPLCCRGLTVLAIVAIVVRRRRKIGRRKWSQMDIAVSMHWHAFVDSSRKCRQCGCSADWSKSTLSDSGEAALRRIKIRYHAAINAATAYIVKRLSSDDDDVWPSAIMYLRQKCRSDYYNLIPATTAQGQRNALWCGHSLLLYNKFTYA